MKEKLAACSVITSEYVEYLAVFCFSLLEKNPEFERDYYVFHETGDISDEQKSMLLEVYPKFIFKDVPSEVYDILDPDQFKGNDHSKSIRKFAYYRLEMFNLTDYDQVIYFDVDMLVLRNLEDFLGSRYPDGIMAAEDVLVKIKNLKSESEYEKHHKVQGGVIVAGKSLLTGEVYKDLTSMLSDTERFELADQSMFVEYFGSKNQIVQLDPLYNCGRKVIGTSKDFSLKNVYIIHYPGSSKPHASSSCSTFKHWKKARSRMNSFLKSNRTSTGK